MQEARGPEEVMAAASRVREIARRDPYASGTTAASVLAVLSEVVECDHASLARWHPAERRHISLADDYSPSQREYLNARQHTDPLFTFTLRYRCPLWLRDLAPGLRAVSTTIRDVIEPSGFEDGMTQCLFSSDGRYVGVLNLSMKRRRLRLRSTDLVPALLGDCLAAIVDAPLPERGAPPPGWATETCTLAVPHSPQSAPAPTSGPVPAWLGNVVPLGHAVRRAAARRILPTTILVPHGRHLLELRLAHQGNMIIATCRSGPHPAGLSLRELQVLAELSAGHTNHEIAARLFVSSRTVATHIEHILAKLGVANRAAAASHAGAWGLETSG
ncbi:LuxR C-terminal-related transcriptional regulator [Streptomyces sp. NPDC020845]|uniref:LuxR C-terminal-related transcriptional regulator n=1 Tax=Streptomyces sp. NPDC020845 TaxID=3365096 RepID=UPI0037A59999